MTSAIARWGCRSTSPIWAAAARHGLPVAMHFTGHGAAVLGASAVGRYPHHVDYHSIAYPLMYSAHLVSWICNGVFDRLPDFSVVFLEGGFLWHRPIIARLARHWPSLRREVQAGRDDPFDYVREHVRFTSQPIEETDDPTEAGRLFALAEADRTPDVLKRLPALRLRRTAAGAAPRSGREAARARDGWQRPGALRTACDPARPACRGGVMTAAPRWEPVPFWAKIPHGMTFRGSATSVAVDSKDRVYVFNRGSHPLMVFDRDGNLLDAWDDRSMFTRPHSIFVDLGDDLWLVDDGGSFIDHRTRGGELIMRLGEKDNPAPKESGEPFNRPCDIGLHPVTGDLYIADGYGNSSIHRYSAQGEHIKSWGQSGADPGEFSLPHHILVTDDDRILVCDRENFRVQVFDPDGKFAEQWHMHRPFCIAMGSPAAPYIFVGEARSVIPNREGIKRLGACVKALTLDGAGGRAVRR